MEFFFFLFPFIIVLTLINRVYDLRKTKVRALAERSHQEELSAIREELRSLKEMVADVLLELDRQGRLFSPDSRRELSPSERTMSDPSETQR